jgi:AAA+ superfamily predicted ATPase
MSEMTDEQRELIDGLATSISKLCHTVIAKRLGQFFEVIGEEMAKERARLLDALNREPGESLTEWADRARATREEIRQPGKSGE